MQPLHVYGYNSSAKKKWNSLCHPVVAINPILFTYVFGGGHCVPDYPSD